MKRIGRRFDPESLRLLIGYNELSAYKFVQLLNDSLNAKLSIRLVRYHLSGECAPNAQTLADYADFFNVPVDYFFRRRTIESEKK